MKQYIKKALWIIPFVYSLNLSATTYYFYSSTGSEAGYDKNNWWDTRSSSGIGSGNHPSNFETPGDIFDINDKIVDVDQMVIGAISFRNDYSSGNGDLYNSGTMEVSSINSFTMDILVPSSLDLGGNIHYSNSTSGNIQVIYPITYYDLTLSGNDKTTSGLKVEHTLDNPNILSVTGSVTLGTNFNFSSGSSTGTIIFIGGPSTSHTDSRTSKTFPGTVVYRMSRSSTSLRNVRNITGTEFNNLTINGTVRFYSSTGNVKVKGNLVMDNYSPSSLISAIYLNGLILTLENTITGSNIFFYGGIGSALIFNKTGGNSGNIIFDGTINNLRRLEINNGTTVNMGSNLTLDSAIRLNSGKLAINSNSLSVSGTITSLSSGCFIGSNQSNLNISTDNTIYFDQSSIDENRTLKNLTIGGSGVTVTLGNWLNITGGTSTSGYGIVDVIAASNNLYTQGYLTLKSNQYGTAMISSSPGNIAYNSSSNDGTLLMENYIAGNSTKGRQYRFLASPVTGGVFWQWRDSSNTRTGRGTHITGKIGTVNIANDSFDISTTNHPSAFYYDETKAGNTTGIGNTSASEDAGWARLTNAKTGTIENGKGYRVLIRGDRSITLTSSTTTTPVNTTIQTRGGYVAGPVSVPITNSGTKTNNGINLVGNPYACAVDWVTIQSNSTSVDPTYVAFDVSSKSYQSYNATGGGGLMSRYISPGQGFLVYTTAASTNLVFPTSSKTTAEAGGRIFTEIKNNHLVTRLIKDSGTYDATIIYFIKGATNYYDAYDAGHIENGNVNLSSVDSTNTLYNLNCMDSLVGSRIIPLSLYGTPKGTYTMAFDDVNTFKNHDVYLIDNYLQKTTKVDDMTQYLVDVNSDKFSYAEGRLAISFEPKPVTSVVTVNKTDIFNISPNPVKDQLIVKMDDQPMGTIEYEIFNVSGQTMLNGTLDSTETKINTSKLMTGIYFINLRANNQSQTIKFIK